MVKSLLVTPAIGKTVGLNILIYLQTETTRGAHRCRASFTVHKNTSQRQIRCGTKAGRGVLVGIFGLHVMQTTKSEGEGNST